MMSFEPLWDTLKTKDISIYKLINDYGISRGTLDNIRHNRNVTLRTVELFCEILNCEIQDVVKYQKESPS